VVRQLSGGVGFTYKAVGGELSGGNYEVIIDQFRFRTEDGDTDDGVCDNSNATACQMRIEKVRIGVGVRIIAHITVAKAGAKLGSLTGIGGNATLENISGTVSAYSYGVLPVPIDFRALAANATLKEGLIPAILNSAAGMLEKLQATEIHLIEPRVFAIKRFKPVSETQTAGDGSPQEAGGAQSAAQALATVRTRPGAVLGLLPPAGLTPAPARWPSRIRAPGAGCADRAFS